MAPAESNGGVSSQPELKLELGLAPAIRARILGVLLIISSVLLIVVSVVAAALHIPTLLVVAIVLVMLVLIAAAVAVPGRWPVFQADVISYRLRLVRGAGVAQGRWRDVEGLATATQDGEHLVVLQLRDGRSTVIPVRLLGIDKEEFVDRLQEILDAANGYKRL